MNYYSFHIGDYAAHTKHLSLLEDLAYRRMLDLYYTSESPLPLEPEKVARLIGMRDHIREVSDVLSDFFLKSEEGHISKRADEEILRYKAKAERAKAANLTRWEKKKSDPVLKSDQKSDADQFPTNNQEPITNNQEKEKTKPRAPRFDALAHLVELGVDPVIATDWIKLRKTKRAEVTATAIDGVSREADKAGLSLDSALRECCSRGWAGFKADWVLPSGSQSKPVSAFKTAADQRKDFLDALTCRTPGQQPESQLQFIEGESRHVAWKHAS